MLQFQAISEEAREIVAAYRSKLGILTDAYLRLMVSLYAGRTDAEKQVVSATREHIFNLADYFSISEIEYLNNEYAAVIWYCFENHIDFQNNPKSDLDMPMSVLRLIGEIADGNASGKLYLPFSGNGALALAFAGCSVDGFEINPIQWAISQILLSSQGICNTIHCEDADTALADSLPKFEYIVSYPPIYGDYNNKEKIVETISALYTQHLAENGEMYCLLPISACYETFSKGWYSFRTTLFDNEGAKPSVLVIGLPPLFQYTSLSHCLVVIKNDGQGIVAFVDANDASFIAVNDEAGFKKGVLKVDSVIETIQTNDEQHMLSIYADGLSEDLNISPKRWLLSQHLPTAGKDEKAYKLCELISPVLLTNSVDNKDNVGYISMKDLFSSYLNCCISGENKAPAKVSGRRYVTSPCLLAGFIGGKFKVGRIEDASLQHPYAISGEIFAFTISETARNMISEDFLLRAILLDATEKQARMLALGIAISRIRQADFFDLTIILPTLDEQERLCKEDSRKSLTEADRKLLDMAKEFRKDVHMNKHAIGQTLFALKSWLKLLQKARRNGNGIVDDNATVGNIQPIKVAEIYPNLQKIMTRLLDQVGKFDVGYGMQVQNIALVGFIEDYINSHESPLFTFVFEAKAHRFDKSLPDIDINPETGECEIHEGLIVEAGEPREWVKFPCEALSIIFDNIISNACSHGFSGRENIENIIKIEIRSEGSDYILSIANNGNKMYPSYTEKDVFTYGRTSLSKSEHSGIGGYQVKKLMQEFGGTASVIVSNDDEFPVTYELRFTETNIVASF